MTITWNIDEARRTIREQMNEANQLDAVIDDLSADLSAAERAREAAEAECERLRAQVAQAKADGSNEERSLHWMRENTEIAALRKQVATLETDHEKLLAMVVDLQDDYSNALKGAYIAEAKVSDLNEQVASLSHTNAVMAGDYGECQQEVERLRKQVATLRTALAYYVEARNVTNWGMEEDEDIGDVARAALEATA